MNRFLIPGILIAISLGIFFTYTKTQYDKVKELRATNITYQEAIKDSEELIKKRDQVVLAYNSISEDDRARLERILPDHIDNVRLIIDIKSLLAKRGISIKNIKTSDTNAIVGKEEKIKKNTAAKVVTDQPIEKKNDEGIKSATLSFSFKTSYENFIEVLKDLESSLRIIEISDITFAPSDDGQYEFNLELKTFWLSQE